MPLVHLPDSSLDHITGGGDWMLDLSFKAAPQAVPEYKMDFGVKTGKVVLQNSLSTDGSTWVDRLTATANPTPKITASTSFATDGHDWTAIGSVGFRW